MAAPLPLAARRVVVFARGWRDQLCMGSSPIRRRSVLRSVLRTVLRSSALRRSGVARPPLILCSARSGQNLAHIGRISEQ